MSRQDKNSLGVLVLVIVMLAVFFLITPFFRFSCSRIFLHDFLGMGHDMLAPGIIFSDFGLMRLIPLLTMFVLWAAVSLWVYHDAERRRLSGILWGLFVFVGNIIGLIIYLIVRASPSSETPITLGPLATTHCPNCAKRIQRSYVACPHCGHKLAGTCTQCGKPTEPDWKACPYCGRPTGDQA